MRIVGNLRKRQNMHPLPSFALAMLTVDSVGVVRGFGSLKVLHMQI